MVICAFCFTATPVGIIIPETRGTTDLPKEIIHTENTPTPVPAMTTAQCRGDTGMGLYERLKTEVGSHLFLQ